MHPSATRDPVGRHASPAGDLSSVDRALQDILDRGAERSASLGVGYQRLWAELDGATRGGKRLRPALLSAACRAWGGVEPGAVAVVGAAVELLHTAFVIHDDVIDGDDRRRGRLNVSGSHAEDARLHGVPPVRAREYGAAAGVLAGDLALAAALRAVATCPVPVGTTHRLLDLFDAALHTTAAGELADVRLSLGAGDPGVEEALTMAERKTSAYSFSLPLQAAGVLAGVPDSVVAAVGELGRLLGTGFQLVDDLQGVFGDPAVTGKSVLSDLRSGKQTSLVVHARGTAAWPALAAYVGNPGLTEEDGARARLLLEAAGSRAFVEQLAARCAAEALSLAGSAGIPSMLVSWLRGLTADVLGRAA